MVVQNIKESEKVQNYEIRQASMDEGVFPKNHKIAVGVTVE